MYTYIYIKVYIFSFLFIPRYDTHVSDVEVIFLLPRFIFLMHITNILTYIHALCLTDRCLFIKKKINIFPFRTNGNEGNELK